MEPTKACFVIAPIGEADSETRKRSDQVLKHIIRPAVQECGYHAVRADEIDKPGIITSQVIQRVVNDPLVVADLTERNPNVFYELAIRHAIRRPLVQLIRKGEQIPFDVAGTRTILFDHHDLDSVAAARDEIVKQIRSLESDESDIETPISVSLDLQLLRQSEDPEDRSLAELVGAVADVRSTLSKLEARLGGAEGKDMLDDIRRQLDNLPRRLDERLEGGPKHMRRKFRFDPGAVHELIGVSSRYSGDPIAIVIVCSMLRDDFPWIYELGLQAYNAVESGSEKSGREAVQRFMGVLEYTLHGPWRRTMYPFQKEGVLVLERLMLVLEDTIYPGRKLLINDNVNSAGKEGDE